VPATKCPISSRMTADDQYPDSRKEEKKKREKGNVSRECVVSHNQTDPILCANLGIRDKTRNKNNHHPTVPDLSLL
jgi:hypothetical protein